MTKIQAIRGMNDILPNDIHQWHYFENAVKSVLKQYNYQEIRLPIVEKSELFHRGVGEATAQRILRKGHNNDIESLLQSIHHAEIEYARTRRFWG